MEKKWKFPNVTLIVQFVFCHPKTMKAQKLGTTVIWGDIGNVEKSKDAKSSLTMAFYRMGPWELTEDKNNHRVSQKHWECGMNVIVKGYYNALLWSTLGTLAEKLVHYLWSTLAILGLKIAWSTLGIIGKKY